MQLVILAGGLGTRLSEETYLKPKPLVEIGNMPIIWHIMKYYSTFGIKEFIICGGYKCHLIKEFFYNYKFYTSDLKVNLEKNESVFFNKRTEDWNIHIINTGLDTHTGGRIKRIKKFINSDNFCVTYGDGLGNVDIKNLINFHKNHRAIATVTVVQPSGKFGAINLKKNSVTKFKEKPQGDGNWINGGFFVLNKKIFSYIKNDKTIWEKEPLENLAKKNNLKAFKHRGFWSPMDTLKDKNYLESLWNSKKAPWKNWNE